MSRFQNKVALVTGSSQGIGAACALKLAEDGCDIVLNGRKLDERGEDLIKQIKTTGRKVEFVEADLLKFTDIGTLISRATSAFGKLDILVNNAGMEIKKAFQEVTEEEYDEVMNLNVK
ncbi:MAG: SDR family NAD(P)-dependent oxidoreductase, partial [Chitinophagaceae bacterium]